MSRLTEFRVFSAAPLLLAIALAGVLQAVLLLRSPTISADGIIFISMAHDLAERPLQTFRHYDQHPGYPVLLLGGTRLMQGLGFSAEPQIWMAGGQAVAYFCGLLSVWVVWLLARELFDTNVANLAAMAFAILPVPRLSAADALSDTPHLLFLLLAAWLAVKVLKKADGPLSSAIPLTHAACLAGSGLFAGLAYWIRPEGLEIVAAQLFVLVLHAWRSRWSLPRLGLACYCVTAAALAVALPYAFLAGKITSKQIAFVKNQSAATFVAQLAEVPAEFHEAASSASVATTDLPYTANATAESLAPAPAPAVPPAAPIAQPQRRYTPELYLRVTGQAVASFLNSACQGFKFAFVPFYFLGLAVLIRRQPHRSCDWLILSVCALHTLLLIGVYVVSGYTARRHVLPIIALSMPYVGLGIATAGEWSSNIAKLMRVKLGRARLPPSQEFISPARLGRSLALPRNAFESAAVAWAVVAIAAMFLVPYSMRAYNREFLPVIDAASWVRKQARPGAGVVCNSPYVGFYTGLPTARLGPEALTVGDAVDRAESDARYDFVILHVNAHDYRSEWQSQVERDYDAVRIVDDPHAGRRPRQVVIYRAKRGQALRTARRTLEGTSPK